MALSGLFDLLKEKMAYLTQRQGVIADNIANAYTPKYKPKDLVSFEAVLKEAGGNPNMGGGIQMATTNRMHLNGMSGAIGPYKVETAQDTYEVKPNGNAVVLEQQMTQLAQTSADYAMVTSLYHKSVGLLKIAIRGGA